MAGVFSAQPLCSLCLRGESSLILLQVRESPPLPPKSASGPASPARVRGPDHKGRCTSKLTLN
jgi:hypothetical protein